MFSPKIHLQNPISLMNNRPKNHVDLYTPQMPELSTIYLNKPSDILCAGSLHIKQLGCGAAVLRMWI